jgi:hypothetical protein
MTHPLAPGTILQQMYVLGRMRQWPSSIRPFYELGSGDGHLSQLLLASGFTGRGFDLNSASNTCNCELNKQAIETGRYAVEGSDFLEQGNLARVDLIISSMVIEHLEQDLVDAYFLKAKNLLNPGGLLVTLVPADMNAWGIEDEIAGHIKRYQRACFREIAAKSNLSIRDIAGLTWPLSNLILPISNFLVARAESHLLGKSMHERTVASGHRAVPFKTTFPWWHSVLFNRVTLFPWYILQLLGRHSERALILYCEMSAQPQS